MAATNNSGPTPSVYYCRFYCALLISNDRALRSGNLPRQRPGSLALRHDHGDQIAEAKYMQVKTDRR